MKDMKFNNYSLSDNEVNKILKDYEKVIIEKAKVNGKKNEDLEQEIRIQINNALTKNKKK